MVVCEGRRRPQLHLCQFQRPRQWREFQSHRPKTSMFVEPPYLERSTPTESMPTTSAVNLEWGALRTCAFGRWFDCLGLVPLSDWLISVAQRLHVLRQDLLCRYAIRFETFASRVVVSFNHFCSCRIILDHATTAAEDLARLARPIRRMVSIYTAVLLRRCGSSRRVLIRGSHPCWLAVDHVGSPHPN
jgi:hypothetical protein